MLACPNNPFPSRGMLNAKRFTVGQENIVCLFGFKTSLHVSIKSPQTLWTDWLPLEGLWPVVFQLWPTTGCVFCQYFFIYFVVRLIVSFFPPLFLFQYGFLFILLLLISEEWEHCDTGHSRSFKCKRLCVIMTDKCEPAQTGLSSLLFTQRGHTPHWADHDTPAGQEFFRIRRPLL